MIDRIASRVKKMSRPENILQALIKSNGRSLRLFADDCVCFRKIKTEDQDTLKLQRDIDRLGSWAWKWGMRFQPVKCNMMQLTNKQSSKIRANYTLQGTVLENVESLKYLGVTIINDLKWSTHTV